MGKIFLSGKSFDCRCLINSNDVYFCLTLDNQKTTEIMGSVHVKIDLSFRQLEEIVKQLSPSDKLKLNDVIWNEGMEIPIEHRKLVQQRIKKSRLNPTRMIDWNKGSKLLKS
jgi:hypothetical protein